MFLTNKILLIASPSESRLTFILPVSSRTFARAAKHRTPPVRVDGIGLAPEALLRMTPRRAPYSGRVPKPTSGGTFRTGRDVSTKRIRGRTYCPGATIRASMWGIPIQTLSSRRNHSWHGLSRTKATSALCQRPEISPCGEKTMHRHALKTALLSSTLMFMAAGTAPAADQDHISFKMVAANPCLPDAKAKVQIISDGEAEDMFVVATGLPPIPLSTSS
jgi:hypothetical protein